MMLFLTLSTACANAQGAKLAVQQTLTVYSDPPAAAVYDGEKYGEASGSGYLGVTPLVLELNARRSYVLYVALEGYTTQRCRIDPGQAVLEVSLTPNTPWSWLTHQRRQRPLLALGIGVAVLLGATVATLHYLSIRRRASSPLSQAAGLSSESDEELGDYKIEKQLGEGADAIVYLARHRTLGDVVALKVLKRDGLDDEARARFNREMEIGRDLRHPNLVRVHAFGEVDGLPYLASEFIVGVTLQAKMADGPLPVSEVLRISAEICRGLDVCHAAGIIHRDLKPSNIMLTADRGVRVLDFGIARRADRRRLTATGAPLGTPVYIAPEQIRGRTDHRADIYSLGVMMFEALSGRPPFDGEDAMAVMMAHCSEAPPHLADLAPEVPPALCLAVDRMLLKDASRRYQSVAEVLCILRGLTESGKAHQDSDSTLD